MNYFRKLRRLFKAVRKLGEIREYSSVYFNDPRMVKITAIIDRD